MTLPADRTDSPDVTVRPEPPTQPPPSPKRSSPWRALVLRLHFYAGVFVAPFLVVAALTGLAYVFSPQLDSVLYSRELHTEQNGRIALPLSDQVAAARAAHSEGTVTEIVPAAGPNDTTRVVLAVPELEDDRMRTVFIDPYTAGIRGELTTWFGYTPVRTWLDDTHRNLQLGDFGRHYSEVAASWLWVVVLGGLYLWWQRVRRSPQRLRRALSPDLSARKGVRRTRGWHAATGVWLAVGLLFLSATGLTWSRYAGGNFEEILTAVDGKSPELSSDIGGPSDHAGHTGHAGPESVDGTGTAEGTGGTVDTDLGRLDAILAAAAAAGVSEEVKLTPPDAPGSGWMVAENDRSIPVHLDRAVLDPVTAEVTSSSRFADWPVLAQVTKLGIAAHMGLLFGLANQVLLAALAIGLVGVVFWGYRMWWQRRPTGTRFAVGPAPKPAAWREVSRWQLAIGVTATALVCWLVPVLGVTLVAFLILDVLIRRLRPQSAIAARTSDSRSVPPEPVAATRPDSST